MTRSSLINPPQAVGLEQFCGSYHVSRSKLDFPGEGTPVVIETDCTGAQIAIGDLRNRQFLNGSIDVSTGHLTGNYDQDLTFEISLSPLALGDRRGSLRNGRRHSYEPSREDTQPGSREWEAD